MRAADVVLDERGEGIGVVERAVVVEGRAFQKRMALLLLAVLPLQVVVPFRLTVRPPTAFRFGPEMVTSLVEGCGAAAPAMLPPVQVTGPWNCGSRRSWCCR